MLAKSELQAMAAETIRFLADNDDQNGADWHLKGKPSIIPVTDQIVAQAGTAADLLLAYDAGVYAYGEPFVRERLLASGLNAEQYPVEYARIAGTLSLTLALSLFRKALATAERHDLLETHALPLSKWARQVAALEKQLLPVSLPVQVTAAPVTGISVSAAPTQHVSIKTQEPVGIDPEEDTFTLSRAAAPKSMLFSDALKTATTERIEKAEIKPTSIRDFEQVNKLWIQILGDRPADQYDRSDARHFRETLKMLPKIYWKSAKDQSLSIKEVIATRQSENPDYQRIAAETVNKHVSTIAAGFDAMIRFGILPKDTSRFWADLGIRTNRRRNPAHSVKQERPRFSAEQIKAIFKHPIYTGCKSEFYYNAPGNIIVRDALYWAPLIVTLHALRREEIAQLQVKHIKYSWARENENDFNSEPVKHYFFDLTDEALRIKSQQGFRIVTLHKWLLQTDFLDHWVKGRAPDERLFPELSSANAHDSFGETLGDRFSRVLEKLSIKPIRLDGEETDGVFHPLRSAAITNMNMRPHSIHVSAYIDGHAPTEVGSE